MQSLCHFTSTYSWFPKTTTCMQVNHGQTVVDQLPGNLSGLPRFLGFLFGRGFLHDCNFVFLDQFEVLIVSGYRTRSILQPRIIKHHKSSTDKDLQVLTFVVRPVLPLFQKILRKCVTNQGLFMAYNFYVLDSNEDPIGPRCRPHVVLQLQTLKHIKLTT